MKKTPRRISQIAALGILALAGALFYEAIIDPIHAVYSDLVLALEEKSEKAKAYDRVSRSLGSMSASADAFRDRVRRPGLFGIEDSIEIASARAQQSLTALIQNRKGVMKTVKTENDVKAGKPARLTTEAAFSISHDGLLDLLSDLRAIKPMQIVEKVSIQPGQGYLRFLAPAPDKKQPNVYRDDPILEVNLRVTSFVLMGSQL